VKIFGDKKTKKRAILTLVGLFVALAGVWVYFFLDSTPFAIAGTSAGRFAYAVIDAYAASDDPLAQVGSEDEVPGEKLTVEGADHKEDFFTFIICGTDQAGGNTDTMLLGAFDVKAKKLSIMSVPRDTIVNVSRNIKRVNAAWSVGGVDRLKLEFSYLIGFEVDRYIIVDLKGSAKIIDAVGGLDFDVPVNMRYNDPTQKLEINISKGFQHLTGAEVIKVMRYRATYPGGDIQRIGVQQKVLKALMKKMMVPETIPKLPQLATLIAENVKTDFTVKELIWLGSIGASLDADSVEMTMLPGTDRTLNGSSYWIPNRNELLKMLNASFNPMTKEITKLNLYDAPAGDGKKPVKPEEESPPSEEPSAPPPDGGEGGTEPAGPGEEPPGPPPPPVDPNTSGPSVDPSG